MTVLTAVLGNITTQNVDVIVNAASPRLRGGDGVDGALHRAGGPTVLRDCIAKFPDGLTVGDAGWTVAGDLPTRWLIHAVGPDHRSGQRDRSLLESCYRRSLELADGLGARSVAFPLIGAGAHGRPVHEAAAAAVKAVADTDTGVEDVRLVALDPEVLRGIRLQLSWWTGKGILRGVQVLHRRGYHRVRVTPGMSASGMYWRAVLSAPPTRTCPNGPPGAPHKATGIQYTTADLTDFAGGEVTLGTPPGAVADLVLAALPHLEPTADDPAHAAWFDCLPLPPPLPGHVKWEMAVIRDRMTAISRFTSRYGRLGQLSGFLGTQGTRGARSSR
ncbi:MAG: O-acetyl-ADP-ribose deacetylase, partial [Actinomycetota bacterium]|nr:O-acetyl-ADP-ribose deacetylase [Actinomycetota bacterium]